jgi:hypothetical protein
MSDVGMSTNGAICLRCGRNLAPGHGYVFATPAWPTLTCLRCAVRHRPIVRKATQTALVVGTILTLINQGDALLARHATLTLLWKILLTYSVPYMVSTYGALSISRRGTEPFPAVGAALDAQGESHAPEPGPDAVSDAQGDIVPPR